MTRPLGTLATPPAPAPAKKDLHGRTTTEVIYMAKPMGETQLLSQDELAVYEAVTVLRRTSTAAVAHASGFDPDVARRALERLAELRFVTLDGDTVELGPHDWDA